jgi:hypothetical protein
VARRAKHGVAHVSAKGCSMCRDVGGGEGEKAAAVARGESGRRLCERGVFPYIPSASGLVWALKRVM